MRVLVVDRTDTENDSFGFPFQKDTLIDNNENTVTHLSQEGRINHHSEYYDEILASVYKDIGKSLAQVFRW